MHSRAINSFQFECILKSIKQVSSFVLWWGWNQAEWHFFLQNHLRQANRKTGVWYADRVNCSTGTVSYLWPNESVQPLNGFIVVYYSIHPIHIQHNLAQSYRNEEKKKQGDIMVLHVNIIFNSLNVSWDFHTLSISVLRIKSEENSWALKLAKSHFREKALTTAEEKRAIPGVWKMQLRH